MNNSYKVIKRDGSVVDFVSSKIHTAITKAYIATKGMDLSSSDETRISIDKLTNDAVSSLCNRDITRTTFHIEDIQDKVELALMRSGDYDVAKAYVIYREERNKNRLSSSLPTHAHIEYWVENGNQVLFDIVKLDKYLRDACVGINEEIRYDLLLGSMVRDMYTGCSIEEVKRSAVLASRTLIERDPIYNVVTARLLLQDIRLEVLGTTDIKTIQDKYVSYFSEYIKKGIELGLLDPELATYDLDRISEALVADRDLQFEYLGLQTLYDRYLVKYDGVRMELPQILFMRVAMGLSLNEKDRETKAIEFYDLLSSFDFMSSTPTLFNSGTTHSQLSSCYLSTISDNLEGIYDGLKENALLSKYAGGLGNDWTPVRALGSYIKGTNGKSQGVIPFMKVSNDTLIAVNQCFSPDTLVYTAKGVKKIKDVVVKDLVLGISGIYREVTETFTYRQEEPMLEIGVKCSIEPIKVTDGHPFWAIKGVVAEQALERTFKQLARGKLKINWVPSGQLEVGDYIAQVIPREIVTVDGITEEDMRFYGLLLGDGHLTMKNGRDAEWGITGNPKTKLFLHFVRKYLEDRNIHYWESDRGDTCTTIRWASGTGCERCPTTGKIIGSLGDSLLFKREDIYTENGDKCIAPRFSHLPIALTRALIRGLLESDGCRTAKDQVVFSSSSTNLAYSLVYQLLRMGLPTYGSFNIRENNHTGVRSDGSLAIFDKPSNVYSITIPAVDWIANLYDMEPIKKFNWFIIDNKIFSRIKYIKSIEPTEEVHDLLVEGDESYMTTGGLCHNGGRRRGSGCAYLEVWHLDIEEFIELRKNTGDDRRRTHDMNIATWIPDLFMKRVMENGSWTLFTPSEVPDLHDLYGQAFEDKYIQYEELAKEGKIKLSRTIEAVQLWRKILGMLFETGHPWITFKDPCNIRSPQQHTGVVHSSNLCCIAKDQRAVTDIGVITIDELYKNQYAPRVAGRSNIESQASPMLLPRPNAPMVRINTEEGYFHKVTPDHRIWVEGKGKVEAQHLEIGDRIELQRYSMYGKGDHPLLAMLAALLKANGRIVPITRAIDIVNDVAVITLKKGITDHLEHEIDLRLAIVTNDLTEATLFEPFVDTKGDIIIQSEGLVDVLNKFNHTAKDINKVPEFVFSGNRKTIEQYLRGIYLGLGIVNLDRHTCSVTLTSDIEFLQDIQLLWLNLGIKSSIINKTKMSTLVDNNCINQNCLATLEISGNMDCYTVEKITGLAKTSNEYEFLEELITPRYVDRNHTATFIGLTELPNEDAYCLTVDSDDHAWTVNGFITHNTEITLNTNEEEIAVCNLGSINLANHITTDGELDKEKIEKTVTLAIRMLDNVIDINFYPVEKARNSNLRHRPIGLGIMGFQDSLHKLGISYADWKAVEFADTSMELIAYHAYYASSLLAEERGTYSSYDGSLWSQGILPLDSIDLLRKERNGYLEIDTSHKLDWGKLRDRINKYGMRNSNCLAIAPTATIANITGVSASIEPTFQNLYAKSNLSGEFTIINKYLVRELKKLNIWDDAMISDIKFYDGILTNISRIPENIKHLYTTAFEMDTSWIVEAAARRQKWIDQAQSLNIYMAGVSGKKMDDIYKLAWVRGLKTTYYLRALSASNAEKSTIHTGVLNKVSNVIDTDTDTSVPMCKIEDPDCESCQ